jgi:hypothetical protein
MVELGENKVDAVHRSYVDGMTDMLRRRRVGARGPGAWGRRDVVWFVPWAMGYGPGRREIVWIVWIVLIASYS